MTIAVLDYGSGNLRSVAHALERVGADVEVTGDHDSVLASEGLVVPGVGHFGAGVTALGDREFDATIKDFIGTGRPVFGVCVGMQVLFEGSEEAPGVAGLGVFRGTVRRLPDDVTVPHMGWNQVSWLDTSHSGNRSVERSGDAWFYFAHSYAVTLTHDTIGTTLYGDTVSAAVARENVFATQFHPEKSGDAGLALYRAFVEDAGP